MRIKSIKEVEPRTVYAIKTSSNTFIADGLAHHNCYGCNVMQQGRQYTFGLALDELYGAGTAKDMHDLAKVPHQFTRDELLEIISEAKTEVKFYEQI
jgi:hypothetical protein